MAKILRCVDTANDLKLIHQNFRRTVPTPPPYPQYCGDGELGRQIQGEDIGFHMDSAFLPEFYESTPRRNYYISERKPFRIRPLPLNSSCCSFDRPQPGRLWRRGICLRSGLAGGGKAGRRGASKRHSSHGRRRHLPHGSPIPARPR